MASAEKYVYFFRSLLLCWSGTRDLTLRIVCFNAHQRSSCELLSKDCRARVLRFNGIRRTCDALQYRPFMQKSSLSHMYPSQNPSVERPAACDFPALLGFSSIEFSVIFLAKSLYLGFLLEELQKGKHVPSASTYYLLLLLP
eukprot:c17058_g1_i1 orf=227-652(-)